MKYYRLFSDFTPCKKCGADPISAAFMGGASLVGNVLDSTVGYNQQSHMQNKALDAQREENQLNRDWQTNEAEKARQFAAGQLQQQNQFQREMQSGQFSHDSQMQLQQSRLNSPVFQRQQLERAGINPQVYFGNQSSFGGSSAPSTGTPSVSSPGSAPSVGSSPSGLNPIGFQPSKLAIGSLLRDLAASAKDLGDNKRAQDMLFEQIRSLSTQSDLNTVLKVGHDIANYLNKQKLPLDYEKAVLDLYKASTEIELNEENAITQRSLQKVNDALAKLHDAQAKLTDKEIEKIGIEILEYPNILKATVSHLKSEAVRNYASAEESRAVARNQISQSELTDLERIIKRNVQGSIEQEFYQRVNNMAKEGKILDWQVDAAESAAQQARVAASHAEELFWKDFVMDVIQGGVSAFTDIRNSKSWSRMSDASQRRVDAKLKEIEYQYGDKVEISTTPKGKTTTRTYRRPYQKYGNTKD